MFYFNMSTIIGGSIARAPSVVPNTICVLMFRPDMNCLFALNNISLLPTPKSTSILGVVFETREVVVVVKMVVFVSVGSGISLDSSISLVTGVSRHRIPEPTRQADILSREFLRDHSIHLFPSINN